MTIKGYEIKLNLDNSVNKFSSERISSKSKAVIESRFYKNFLYIEDINKKRGISPLKNLFFCKTEGENSGFHFEPKGLINRVKLMFYYKKYWLQSNGNIMWVINICVAILAIIATLSPSE